MKTLRLIVFGVVSLWALPMMALLPPDAQFRKNEILQQRIRAREDYEQQQQEYGKAVVASRIRMQAAMEKPPWMRTSGNKVRGIGNTSSPFAAESPLQINHRFLVSIVLLILIGVAAGLVRYMTRELDDDE